MAKEEKKIFVYENWSEETPVFMGTLYANAARGAEVFSFEYDESFLRKGKRFTIDPELEFFSGRQYTYQKEELSLNVNDEDNSIDINLAIETSRFFQLDKNEANNLAEKICLIVHESWEGTARRYGLSRGQIEIMRPAFDASNWGK
jgi:hypothetical protein